MSVEFPLTLSFKGSRQYLHGTDMHDAVCDLLTQQGGQNIQKIDFTLHRIVLTQLVASIHRDTQPETEGANAVFRATVDSSPVTVLLKECGTPVTDRRPYDEEGLVSAASFDSTNQRITFTASDAYTNIEMIVALNKALLLRALPEAKGKWLFTRLQLATSIKDRKLNTIEVRFLGHSNYRITRSQVFGDGQPIGSIFFSLMVTE